MRAAKIEPDLRLNLGKHLQFDWLCVSSMKTGSNALCVLCPSLYLTRITRRTTNVCLSSSRRIMCPYCKKRLTNNSFQKVEKRNKKKFNVQMSLTSNSVEKINTEMFRFVEKNEEIQRNGFLWSTPTCSLNMSKQF